jgi:hypothetical protein
VTVQNKSMLPFLTDVKCAAKHSEPFIAMDVTFANLVLSWPWVHVRLPGVKQDVRNKWGRLSRKPKFPSRGTLTAPIKKTRWCQGIIINLSPVRSVRDVVSLRGNLAMLTGSVIEHDAASGGIVGRTKAESPI